MTIKEYSCYLFDWLRFNSSEDVCSKCANLPEGVCRNVDQNSVEFDYNYCYNGLKRYAEQQRGGKQIKSRKRVRERGEVFTAQREVEAMCDLIPRETWENITATFLEPACGNGNFLVEIYSRKLQYCKDERDGLKALASIVGIDIMPDNCVESRQRLKNLFCDKFPEANSFSLRMAELILKNNIICADSLKLMKQWRAE